MSTSTHPVCVCSDLVATGVDHPVCVCSDLVATGVDHPSHSVCVCSDLVATGVDHPVYVCSDPVAIGVDHPSHPVLHNETSTGQTLHPRQLRRLQPNTCTEQTLLGQQREHVFKSSSFQS